MNIKKKIALIVLVALISFVVLPTFAFVTFQGNRIPSYLEVWLVSNGALAFPLLIIGLANFVFE